MTSITDYFTTGHEPSPNEMLSMARLTNIATNWSTAVSVTADTNTSYVNLGMSVSWSKTGSAAQSDILVLMHIGWRVNTSVPSAWIFGINIGGTDTDIVRREITTNAGSHYETIGFRQITGVAAGSYTPAIRMKRVSGTGSIGIDNNDTIMLLVGELPTAA